MTALETLSLIGLITNFSLFIFGTALVVIVIWQNLRSRLNQYLALMMGAMAVWGIFNAAVHTSQHLTSIDGLIASKISTSGYFLAVLALLFFITQLEVPEKQSRYLIVRIFHMIWVSVILIMVWDNRFWSTIQIDPDGTFHTQMTTLGFIVSVILLATMAVVSYSLVRSQHVRQATIVIAYSPLFLGGILVLINFTTVTHIINAITAVISIVLVTRIILNDQLFNPLVEMYAELTTKNTELEDASRHKSEFLANMSHELRTPLNSIIGYTELLLTGMYGELTPQQDDRLKKVHSNGHRLLELINHVLDLSKLDAGRLIIQPVHISPKTLLDQALETLDPLVADRNITLSRDYNNLPMLYVDEVRTRQIIVNVLANAIHFAKAGTFMIGGYLDVGLNQVVITVTITGSTMLSANASRISEALEHVSQSEGLGLAISRRLAELHGGRVWFTSVPGQGNTFYISLPAAAHMAAQAKGTDLDPGEAIRHDTSRPLVLAIDDDLQAIEVIQDYLQPEGYRVFGALSGREGLLRAQELQPSIITLDILMPGMDGWAVLEALKLDENLQHIPVVIASITDQATLPQQQQIAGSITKPITRRALLHAVRQATAEINHE